MHVYQSDQTAAAVDRCRQAQASWAALSFGQRAAMLGRYRDCLLESKAEISDAVCVETGVSRAEALGHELFFVCDAIGYWGRTASRHLADRQPPLHLFKHKRAHTTHRPRGVVGMVTAEQFPFLLTIGEAIPALMAGNGVVIRPAVAGATSAELGCTIAERAGLPSGLLQAVTGDEETVMDIVALVDMVSFAGSVEVGRRIRMRCAELLKPISLELSGRDAMIVCRDADRERAAEACVWRAVGRARIAAERIYVDAKVHDDFVERVVARVGRLQPAIPDRPDSGERGDAAAATETIERRIEQAKARGARVLIGGTRLSDARYAPTVIVDVTHDMEIMTAEILGPIIAIQKVSNEAEALRLANEPRFGRAASVWSRDKAGAVSIARRIAADTVCINDHAIDLRIPEVSKGIRKYCDQQSIVVDRFGPSRWIPGRHRRDALLARTLDLAFRSGLLGKLRR